MMPNFSTVCADRLHAQHRREPRRHRVQRFFERDAQRRRPAETVAAVVGRRPGRHARPLADRHRRVVDQGRGREAVFERGQIDERLDRRAGLPLGLGGAVELAHLEAEAAAHRQHAPGMRVDRDHRARDFGDLAQIVERAAGDVAGRSASPRCAFGAAGLAASSDSVSTSTRSPGLTTSAGRARRGAERAVVAQRPRPAHLGERDAPGLAALAARSSRRPRRCAAPPPAASRPSRRRQAAVSFVEPGRPVAGRRDRYGRRRRASRRACGHRRSARRAAPCRRPPASPASRLVRTDEPALVQGLLAIARQQLAPHLLGEIGRRHDLGLLAAAHRERLGLRGLDVGSRSRRRPRPCGRGPSRGAPWPPAESGPGCSCWALSAGRRDRPPRRASARRATC